jgi:hypothetical protein
MAFDQDTKVIVAAYATSALAIIGALSMLASIAWLLMG